LFGWKVRLLTGRLLVTAGTVEEVGRGEVGYHRTLTTEEKTLAGTRQQPPRPRLVYGTGA